MTVAAPPEARTERLTVYVPKSLRFAVKAAAALAGLTMSEWVIQHLTESLPTFTPATPE